MDQNVRKSNFEEVRKSVVRICFDWKKKKDYQFMVIPGTIVSVGNDGSAEIIANSIFFKKRLNFFVSFPNKKGYEKQSRVSYSKVVQGIHFCKLVLKPNESGFIKAVKLERRALKSWEWVEAFVFPRTGYITPAAYCSGHIIDSTEGVGTSFHDCPLHEYGYLGSPLFNSKGHLVGISYNDQGRVHAHTVAQLQRLDLKRCNRISYVWDGEPMAEE